MTLADQGTEGEEGMSVQDALTALLTEYELLDCLDQWDDVIREQVREEGYEGLTEAHPRVQRYRKICQVLKTAAADPGVLRP